MQQEQDVQLTDTTDSKYKIGQVWKYKSRPTEPTSTFTVLKVEHTAADGNIIHVRVDSLRMKNPQQINVGSSEIGHMPFAEAALDSSVTELLKSDQAVSPDYREGYEIWREAFVAGKGGIFSVPVNEGVAYSEETMATGTRAVE
jgi:hypothetical protein